MSAQQPVGYIALVRNNQNFRLLWFGQIISLRYGMLPIVRETGGLKDTVLSFNEDTGEGNGFSFTNYNAHDMLYTIRRALRICSEEALRVKLQRAAMAGDYSWQHSAVKYIDLYRSMRGR